jgi:type VI secretion system protein ImpC
MPKPLSFGSIGVTLTAGAGPATGAVDPQTPFRVVILGDFNGRTNRGGPASSRLADRRPLPVDRDDLDEVLARIAPELHLPLAGSGQPAVPVRFTRLDDFHPDHLFQRVETFQALRDLRRRLADPATFAEAADEVRAWGTAAVRTEPAPAAEPERPAVVSPENLLEQMLGGPSGQSRPAAPAPAGRDWQALVQAIVEPYLQPSFDYSRQAQLLRLVDDVTGRQMRTLLHHPDFQALEAAWRGIDFLVRRLETGIELKLFLLDLPKAELDADLAAADDLQSTAFYRLFVERSIGTAGGQPWAVLAGLYTFGPTRQDVELLGRLAKVARQAGAPFLAAADIQVVGCASFHETPDPDDWRPGTDPEAEEAWQALRGLPEASCLGLALPRFLLRLPYGKATDPTEQFDLEETAEGQPHESYLWGNPALACVCLLGQAFSRSGWDLCEGLGREIDRLPVHTYKAEGECRIEPCAEAWLTDRAAEAILDKGVMPLLSVQGRDAVRLGALRSLAEPDRPLAGRWA